MALHLLPSEDLRTYCRQKLETCEIWLRRLVHDQFHSEFGGNYVETANLSGQAIFRTEIRKHVAARRLASPRRYARPIDALELDQLKSVICKHDVYTQYFKTPFEAGFPTGNNHLRLILGRLIPIRNALSHANALSVQDAQRVLCYCDDIISSLTDYYASIGMANDFDAPSFIRFSDSVGNVEFLTSTNANLNFKERTVLQEGQSLRLEVEVDSHYSPDDYTVKWAVVLTTGGGEKATGTAFPLMLEAKHVGMELNILVTVESNKPWHRHGHSDAILVVMYRVHPLT